MNDLAGRHSILLPFYDIFPPRLRMTRLMRSSCETTHTILLIITMYVHVTNPNYCKCTNILQSPAKDFRPCYADFGPANTTTALSYVKDIPSGHQDFPEDIGLLASCSAIPRPSSDSRGPLSADGSTLRPSSPSALVRHTIFCGRLLLTLST